MLSIETIILIMFLFSLSDSIAGVLGVKMLWQIRYKSPMVVVGIYLFLGYVCHGVAFFVSIFNAPKGIHYPLAYIMPSVLGRVAHTAFAWVSVSLIGSIHRDR